MSYDKYRGVIDCQLFWSNNLTQSKSITDFITPAGHLVFSGWLNNMVEWEYSLQ
jgi:hypothetical protein